jgi:hypothetical protein
MTSRSKDASDRFQEFITHYYKKPTDNKSDFDLSYTDSNGEKVVYEIKYSKPNLIDRINGKIYSVTGISLAESKSGILSFDERKSEYLFMENGADIVTKYEIRKNNLQWLMSKELFDIAPNACSLADLSNEYEALNYFHNDKPDDDKEYKIFINTRKRINETLLVNLRVMDVVKYSGRDYWINESFVQNRDK